jgi:hypothetical protein
MRLTTGVLALAGLLSLGGCRSFFFPEATDVAQGRYYSSGEPDYDEFFLRVYRLQVALKDAPAKVERLMADLSVKLGLTPTAAPPELRAALTEKLRSLGGKGITLRLERDVGGGVYIKQNGTATGADAAFLETLGQAVAAIDSVRDRIGPWQRDLDSLPPRGIELDRRVDEVFRLEGRGKRGTVHENLADAQKVMGMMRSLLKDADARSTELAEAVIGVLGASAPPPPSPSESEPEPEADPEVKSRPRAAPTRRSGPAAAPRPAPTPKPASGDGPPAPKPVQGTAKPDFEP